MSDTECAARGCTDTGEVPVRVVVIVDGETQDGDKLLCWRHAQDILNGDMPDLAGTPPSPEHSDGQLGPEGGERR